MPDPTTETGDPRLVAAVALLGRTGARDVQMRYSDDQKPLIWLWVATYNGGMFEVGAGPTPLTALFRLCDQVMTGGECRHCKRPTGFEEDFTAVPFLDAAICWYKFDPELSTFRRGCEGAAS